MHWFITRKTSRIFQYFSWPIFKGRNGVETQELAYLKANSREECNLYAEKSAVHPFVNELRVLQSLKRTLAQFIQDRQKV